MYGIVILLLVTSVTHITSSTPVKQVRLLRNIRQHTDGNGVKGNIDVDNHIDTEVIQNINTNISISKNGGEGYWYEGDVWNGTPERQWIPVNDTILANLRYRSTQHPSVVGYFSWIEMVTMARYNIRPVDAHHHTHDIGNGNDDNDGLRFNNSLRASNDKFQLQAYPFPPMITSVSQSTVGIAGGSLVTIYGADYNLFTNLQFYINPSQLMTPIATTSTYAVVAIPTWSGSDSWKTNLVVGQCATEWSVCGAPNPNVKISYANPVITSIFPITWCPSGGTKVTLTGTNFGYGEVAKNFYTYISVEPSKVASPTIWYDATKTPSYRITDTQIVSGALPISGVVNTWLAIYLAWGSGPYTGLANAGLYDGTGC